MDFTLPRHSVMTVIVATQLFCHMTFFFFYTRFLHFQVQCAGFRSGPHACRVFYIYFGNKVVEENDVRPFERT